MKKNELRKNEGDIIRILDTDHDKLLVIDCLHQKMPYWADTEEYRSWEESTEEELCTMASYCIRSDEDLSAEDRKTMNQRFGLIAGVLPYIGSKSKRVEAIALASAHFNIGKQTIRRYLWQYLAYGTIYALAPPEQKEKPLTEDQKTMRWSLNKFFYTGNKNSLKTSYIYMLQEKYCDREGNLIAEHPSFDQYRYFYRTHRSMSNFFIKREGLSRYQRDHRPLLGAGVEDLASAVGHFFIDSTVADIYLINDAGQVAGRPVIVAVIDGYSRLLAGIYVGYEGGVESVSCLIDNLLEDKVELGAREGIKIEDGDWPSMELPGFLYTDRGTEYMSVQLEGLTEFGVSVINLPSYRPDLKGCVEQLFDIIQELYKPLLQHKGVIRPDYAERGAEDYRKQAVLTLKEFRNIVLRAVVYYNRDKVLEGYPYTRDMLDQKVKPHAADIWRYGLKQPGVHLIKADRVDVQIALKPKTTAKFTRKGLMVDGIRYGRDGYTDRYLEGNEVTVSYDPEDTGCVWLRENGSYVPFYLIEKRYEGMTVEEISEMNRRQKELVRDEKENDIQARIRMNLEIQAIARAAASTHPKAVDVSEAQITRRKERKREHNGKHYV